MISYPHHFLEFVFQSRFEVFKLACLPICKSYQIILDRPSITASRRLRRAPKPLNLVVTFPAVSAVDTSSVNSQQSPVTTAIAHTPASPSSSPCGEEKSYSPESGLGIDSPSEPGVYSR